MYRIYLITNQTNGKFYVGQTKKTLEQRFAGHVRSSVVAQQYLARAIAHYGVDNFKIELLETVNTKEAANAAEVKHIATLGSNNPSIGYNLTVGGDGGDTFSCQTAERQEELRKFYGERAKVHKPWKAKWSKPNAREEHSLALKANYSELKAKGIESKSVLAMNTPEVIQKRNESIKKAFSNPEVLAARNEAIRKAHNDPAFKAKRSEAGKGSKNPNARETTVKGMTFATRKEAAAYFGVSDSTVLKWLRAKEHDPNTSSGCIGLNDNHRG